MDAIVEDGHAGLRARYGEEPSRVVAGWFIVYDRETGLAARTGRGGGKCSVAWALPATGCQLMVIVPAMVA